MKYEKTGIQILKSRDYDSVKKISSNRSIKEVHVRKLVDSLKNNGFLINPVILNEKHEIIDGQHRLEAAKRTNTEFLCVIVDGYNEDHMKELNLDQINWTRRDWMDHYADKGYEHYVTLKNFIEEYPNFNLGEAIKLLQNNNTNASRNRNYADAGWTYAKVFEEGSWEIKDLDTAIDWAEKIKSIKKYYNGYSRAGFVSVMISLFRNDQFDFDEFERKLQMQPTALVDCANRDQWLMLIEDIYNWRNRNKVNLRFSE